MGLSLLATITTSATFIVYLGTAYAGDWSLLIPGHHVCLLCLGVDLLFCTNDIVCLKAGAQLALSAANEAIATAAAEKNLARV